MDFSKKAQSFCECSRSGRKDRSYSPKRRRKRKGKVVNASLVAVEEDPMAIGAMNTLLDENWEAAPAASRGEGWSREYSEEGGTETYDSHGGGEASTKKK